VCFVNRNVFIYIFTTINLKTIIMKTINDEITLTNVIDKLNIWIGDVQFDLTEDWNEEKPLMQQQLQQLLVAKANLELIKETGGQILSSSISK